MTTIRVAIFTCGDCERCYEDRDGEPSQAANACDLCGQVICMACSPSHGCNPNDGGGLRVVLCPTCGKQKWGRYGLAKGEPGPPCFDCALAARDKEEQSE